jgi:hypothetical protein
VELTMTSDLIPAILQQLAAHDELISQLDGREAGHLAALTERLDEITGLITGIGGTLHDHAAALARLGDLDRQVTDLAAQLAPDTAAGPDPDRYRPGPAPNWWKLTIAERQQPISRLRAWVEQVYRPGYGHLAATLGPCWASHDLCLYGLDILADLWAVLYLQPRRNAGLLSAQAEYQARILPALAAQLMTETSHCGHARQRIHGPGPARSAP